MSFVPIGPLVGMLLGFICRTWMTAQDAIAFYGLVAFVPFFVSLMLDSKKFRAGEAIVFGLFALSGFIIGMGFP